MTKRRKTLQYVVLAVIAASAVSSPGRSREREARRPEREEGRSHHLHEPEPLLRRLGELGQERAAEAGRSVEVLTSVFDPASDAQNMNRLIAEKPNLIISVPSSASAIVPSYIRAKAAGIPVLGAIGRQSAAGAKLVTAEAAPTTRRSAATPPRTSSRG